MPYELPKLNYAYDVLEPHFDKETMMIHHSKHHQGYVDKLNTALEGHSELADLSIEELLKGLDSSNIEAKTKTAIHNNGGGHFNHSFFWQVIDPGRKKDDLLIKEIEDNFSSVDKFKEQFTELATTHFGSGWTWLVKDENGKLAVYSLPNQDTPLEKGHQPILTIDLWEHAYYLKFQNRRPEYIENWWKVVKLIG
ncbi:MAG: superoxide dismutase [Patescibacteria group bacterium]